MVKPLSAEQVYFALKNVFKGKKVKATTIRTHIEMHQKQPAIDALISKHSIDKVYAAAKNLIDEDIFYSTRKAKQRFPILFNVSPAQSAARKSSEAAAARIEADAFNDIDATEGRQKSVAPKTKEKKIMHYGVRWAKLPGWTTVDPPSRLYLPFPTQHRILARVQAMLEAACYNFGRQVIPDIMKNEGWDSPETIELSYCACAFKDNEDKFDAIKIKELGKPFTEVLDLIVHLRHTVVHRLPVTAARTEQFLSAAEHLSPVRHSEKVSATAAQQAELDRLGKEAGQDMLKEDEEY
ncbi:hypothetical protein E2P81_ATG03897 [Venturia nashicola]|nr:hypothetical protein E2P81_ATG03897 [Venturia nashicola]